MRSGLTLGMTMLMTMAVAAGCGDDGGDDMNDTGGGGTGAAGGSGGSGASGGSGGSGGGGGGTSGPSVEVELAGVEPLANGYEYEGWLIVDGNPVSTGRFNVEDGVPMYSFPVSADDAEAASAFVLTIEPPNDPDPAPSDAKYLGGDFDGTAEAMLSIGHMAALGDDFSGAAGLYILETPSSGSTSGDYDQGIWWLMMPGPAAGLTLPDLPAGWVYEGWVVDQDGPISTGRFTAADMADDDMGGPDAGPDDTPPFPGQDYIDPALSLVGLTAVISVEPEDDDSPAPFAIKPLIDADIEDVGAGVTQSMDDPGAIPDGTATLVLE